jgi:transposase
MRITLTERQRAELEAAAAAEKRVRPGKRYRAVLLRAAGMTVAAVAQALECSQASVYAWSAAWRAHGVAGLRDGARSGRPRRLDGDGEALLRAVLEQDPQAHGHQATGWTVPLLRTELAAAGYQVGARTLRRALHRLGYRWKRPQYVLGRPDAAYTEKRGPSAPPRRPCSPPGARSGWAMRRRCANFPPCGRAGVAAGSRPA